MGSGWSKPETLDTNTLRLAILAISMVFIVTSMVSLVFQIDYALDLSRLQSDHYRNYSIVSLIIGFISIAATAIVGSLLLMIAKDGSMFAGTHNLLQPMLIITGAYLVVKGVVEFLHAGTYLHYLVGGLSSWILTIIVYGLAYVICGLFLIGIGRRKSRVIRAAA